LNNQADMQPIPYNAQIDPAVIHRGPPTKAAPGFTLIELIAVIALITLMLGFATPRLAANLLEDQTKKASRWLLLTIPALKMKAVSEGRIYRLKIDLSGRRLWSMNDDMNEEQLEAAAEKSYQMPDEVWVMDVAFADDRRTNSGEAEIVFSPQGYSDQAIIHLENRDGARRSFLIEPFLPNVKMVDGYVEG
jgi:prepilin-type N-terminal cleavage/methylation domain-containing protein